MNKREKLNVAAGLVHETGSYWMFQKSYTEARQFYDVETSLEMALEEQNLLSQYLERCEKTTIT